MSRLPDALADGRYPSAPGSKEKGSTSEGAARSLSGVRESHRAVLDEIARAPQTADEVAQQLGLKIWFVRPRVSELRALGRIEPTGAVRANESRRPAKVWRITKGTAT